MDDSVVVISTIVMLVFLFLKVPVFVSVLSASVTYFILTPNIPTKIIAQRFIVGVESIPLLAIPFFVSAGVFMNYSGVTKRVLRFSEALIGRMPGGLAQVNILLSTMMGGLSGSNLADAAMQSKMLVPEMEKNGFSKEFSSVVTATSAMITPMIPPGISMIIYGSIANVSIGKLFIAGIGPGLLLCISMMFLVGIISRKDIKLQSKRISKKRDRYLFKSFRGAFFALCLPVIIIGGIRLGVFTPTEAGAVAIVYSLLLGVVYRDMEFKNIVTGLKETILTTSSIMLIVGAASAFAWVLTRERIPQQVTHYIVSTISDKYIFLLIINVLLLFIGMFIEGNAAMIVLVPLLVPIARSYGIDDIQFAMVFIFNMAIGTITPPMGTLMFVTCSITGCKIDSFIKEAIPFYVLLFVCLMLLTFVPLFSTGVVRLFY